MKSINYLGILCFGDVPIDGLFQWLNNPIVQQLLFPGIVAFSETDQTIIHANNLQELHRIMDQQYDPDLKQTWFPLVSTKDHSLRITVEKIFPTTKYPGLYIKLQFTTEHLENNVINHNTLKQIITDTVQVLPVTYMYLNDGTVNPDIYQLYKGPDDRAYWARIGWIYYYGQDLVSFIGEEKFEKLETYYEKIRLPPGYLITLTEEPFDIENNEHRERQQQALHELGIDDFPMKYPL